MKNIYTTVALVIASITTTFSQWTNVTSPCATELTAMTNIGSKLFVGSGQGVYSTVDEGLTWDTVSNGIEVFSGFTFGSSMTAFDGVLYYGTTASKLFSSSDEGANWTEFHANFFQGLGSPDHNYFYKNGSNLISAFGESGGIRYSLDNGTTWAAANMDLNNGSPTITRSIVAIGTKLFASTLGGVAVSTDNGANWNLVSGAAVTVGSGTLFESSGNLIYSLYGTGTYYSTDEGATWINVGMTNMTCIEGNDNVVFISGPDGIFQSDDNGVTWVSIKDNLLLSMVTNSMRLFGNTLFMYDLLGVHKRTINTQSSSLVENSYKNFKLFPNPTNGKFNISVVSSEFSVEIYDLFGKKIVESKNTTEFDLSIYAKGIYLLKLADGKSIFSQRIILE